MAKLNSKDLERRTNFYLLYLPLLMDESISQHVWFRHVALVDSEPFSIKPKKTVAIFMLNVNESEDMFKIGFNKDTVLSSIERITSATYVATLRQFNEFLRCLSPAQMRYFALEYAKRAPMPPFFGLCPFMDCDPSFRAEYLHHFVKRLDNRFVLNLSSDYYAALR